MFELFCKISFFLFMLVMYGYVTSTTVVAIIILGYILCVFSYYYFQTIKTAIDELLNYIQNHGIPKSNLNPPPVPNYPANKKYNKVNNAVNVPTMNNKIYVPICRNNNVFSSNTPAVFTCKFNNFVLNGDLSSPLMRNGLSVESGYKSRDKLKLPLHNMNKGFNNSSPLRFRNNSQSGHNPFTSGKKYSNNLDMETYMNVKSPGFTSRIVDKAMESASYHIKYPAVKQISAYRFDKSTLRHFSKIPRMNSIPFVRIAPPEPISIHLLNDIEKKLDKNETKEQSFLHAAKDSRKRNYSQEGGNEKSNGTAKKSRKNDIKNFTISQYKRSLEDKSRDILEDTSKRRCDDNRDAPKMVVYAPTLAMAPNSCPNIYSKKRKSSKTDKSKNECAESIEKYRKIDNSPKEIAMNEYPNEKKSKNCDLKSFDPPSVKNSKPDEVSDQRINHAEDESIDDGSSEYVRVASGKILNRTNRLYRRKLNSNKIDPVSVIASEPEVVGKVIGSDDVAMKEHLLQNLLSHIERKGHKDERVVFYENSIIEEVSKQDAQYDEPLQQVPNPIFTDGIVPNVDEVEMNDVINGELGSSVINFAYLPSNKSTSYTAMHHSTPITSNTDLRRSYSVNSNEPANHVSSKVFGSGSPITSVDNGSNFTDSGYDSLMRETSVRNSTSFNQSFSFAQKSAFASSNGFDSKIQQLPITSNSETNLNAHFGNASTSSFGSGDGKFFNPGNIVFNSLINSEPTAQIGNKGDNYNFGTVALNGKTSIRFEPSFSAITSNSTGTFSVFGNDNPGSVTNANFSISAGDNFKNHAARIGRNKSNH